MHDIMEDEDKVRIANMVRDEGPVFTYYINPNQFDGDDEGSELAFFDKACDVIHESKEVAINEARRLVSLAGHRVKIDIVVEFPSGRREFDHYASVLPSGKILYA